MTATFSNPRLSAIPCERMRSCSFADDFVTEVRMEDNGATVSGSIISDPLRWIDHGYRSGSSDAYYYVVSQPSNFSVKIQFAATETSTGNLIFNNNVVGGTDGFVIQVDPTGVRANHGGAAATASQCSVDIEYADGEIHTVTYVVDMDGGTHSLYVDDLDVDTVATSINEEIGKTNAIKISVDFYGTVYAARIFDAILTESEHDMYHAGTLKSFMDQPLAVYRCDEICDDTDGHKIWDRTLNLNDLYKADRVTSSKFPTFNSNRYEFDLVDDYVSNIPTLPTEYTVVAATSIPQNPYPAITQENDSTLIDLLSTEGSHWGYLYNLAIHTGNLNQLQLNHAEYMHLYNLWRGRAYGVYHRLITEDTCKVAMFLDYTNSPFVNYARNMLSGYGHFVTHAGDDGSYFLSSDSNVTIDHNAELNSDSLSIVVYGNFAGSEAAGTIVDKGTDYKLLTNGNQIDFNGSTISHTFDDNKQIAVVSSPGVAPRFFVDGTYIGDGSGSVPPVNNTDNLTIGNNNELNSPTRYAIKQLCICDETLTDAEIMALYNQAQMIGATAMEAGSRIEYRATTSAALDVDLTPAEAFQLIDISITFDVTPLSSEDVTITAINALTDVKPQFSYDPSVVTDELPVRFDKRFPSGTTITVDYPNTDTNAVVCNIVYQLDPSV